MSKMRDALERFSRKITERCVYKMVLVACAVDHFVFIFLFYHMGATLMTFLNIFSTLLYTALFFVAGKSDLRVIGTLAYLEISLHSVLATLAVGWSYGFAQFLTCIVPLAFYLPYKKMRTSFALCLITVITFAYLKIYSSDPGFIPYRTTGFTQQQVTAVYIYNSIVSFLMLIVLSLVYNLSNKRVQSILRSKNAKLSEYAYTDPLTGLLNRRSMYNCLKECHDKARRNKEPFSVVMSDIDDFKLVNDSHGHSSGDTVLKTISDIYTENAPEGASVCRWGGEEILILLPDCELEQAAEIADKLRKLVEDEIFENRDREFSVTVTMGVSANSGKMSVEKMISIADGNLYTGKKYGKNCVVC